MWPEKEFIPLITGSSQFLSGFSIFLLYQKFQRKQNQNKEEKCSCLLSSCFFPVMDIIQKSGHGGLDAEGRGEPDDEGAFSGGHPDVPWRPDGNCNKITNKTQIYI